MDLFWQGLIAGVLKTAASVWLSTIQETQRQTEMYKHTEKIVEQILKNKGL